MTMMPMWMKMTFKGSPPPHHAPDTGQFRPFFFVLDLFFLCLHLKSMYIEMLEIHF